MLRGNTIVAKVTGITSVQEQAIKDWLTINFCKGVNHAKEDEILSV